MQQQKRIHKDVQDIQDRKSKDGFTVMERGSARIKQTQIFEPQISAVIISGPGGVFESLNKTEKSDSESGFITKTQRHWGKQKREADSLEMEEIICFIRFVCCECFCFCS